MIKQVSVFLENKEGRLKDVLKLLKDNDLDIRSFTIAETSDYGVLRLLMNDSQKTAAVLKQNNFRVNETEVLPVELDDKIGAIYELVSLLAENNINIEYAYNCINVNNDKAACVLRVNDDKIADARRLLADCTSIKLMEV